MNSSKIGEESQSAPPPSGPASTMAAPRIADCPADGTPRTPPYWTSWAIWFGVLALLLKLVAQSSVADLDMFHELALIREALGAGEILRHDVYAYTPTVYPVIHHEWATGAVLYLVAVATGWGGAGIVGLRFVLIAGVILGCYWCAKQRGADGLALVPLAPAAIGMLAPGLSPVRAHLFTFFFLSCLLVMFELDRQGRRWWIAAWLPLYVVWLNMHGGFVVGAGLFLLYATERFGRSWFATQRLRSAFTETQHLLLACAAMAVLPQVSPYGAEYLPYLWHAIWLDRPLVDEWAPLWDPRVQFVYAIFFAVSLLILIYASVRAGNPLRLQGLALVLVSAFVAVRSQRLLPIYGIVWISYVPAYLMGTDLRVLIERFWRRYPARLAGTAVLVGAILTAQAVAMRPWELRIPTVLGNDQIHYPVGAVSYLAEHRFEGNLMTPFDVGAFVSWMLYPAVKVGMDSRYEVAYPPSAVGENFTLYVGKPGWEMVLSKYLTDAVLVPSWSPLDSLLLGSGDTWLRVYADDGYAVFVRPSLADGLPNTDRTGQVIKGSFP